MLTRRSALAIAIVALFACNHSQEGTILDVSYRLQLDGAYRRAEVPPEHHEDVWYSDDEDAPIVSVHVTASPVESGKPPRCEKTQGVGWSQGLGFFPDAPDRLRNAESANLSSCSNDHPELVVWCNVYFRSGKLEQSRASEVLAPCRTLVVR